MTETTTPKRSRGRPRSAWSEDQVSTVQALERGLTLLDALAQDGAATLSDLAQRVGMPTSSAHRLLATLRNHRYVAFDETTQTWAIGIQTFRVGAAFALGASLIEAGRKILHALVRDTGETANLGLVDGAEVVFVSQVETPNPIRAFFRIGARAPLHASGIGKALLAGMSEDQLAGVLRRTGLQAFTRKTLTTPEALRADLARTRTRGWALDDEERHDGMRCVAAAIHNVHGEAIGGISVSGPRARFEDADLDDIAAKVRAAALAVEETTGGARPRGA